MTTGKKWARHACGAVLLALLAACGGGGGGSDNTSSGSAPGTTPAPTPAPAQTTPTTTLTFDQKTLAVSTEFFSSPFITLTGKLNEAVGDDVRIHMIQKDSLFVGEVQFYASEDRKTFSLILMASPWLDPGTYTGTLQVQLCKTYACTSEYGQQRASLPYTFVISPKATSGGSITPDRANVSSSWHAGNPIPASFNVALSTPLSNHRSLQVRDQSSLLDRTLTNAVPNGDRLGAAVNLVFNPKLAPGTYNGTVQLKMCMNDGCSVTDDANAITVPYSVTVLAAETPTPLRPLAGAPDWSGWQGNAAHSGYVPVTVDPTQISPRWVWQSSDGPLLYLTQTVSTQNTAYVSLYRSVQAINELDRTDRSQAPLLDGPGQLAAANGVVYAVGANLSGQLSYVSKDANGSDVGSGHQAWAKPANYLDFFWSAGPTFYNGALYVQPGAQGGVRGIDLASSNTLFDLPPSKDRVWTPTVDEHSVYTWIQNADSSNDLRVSDRLTGATTQSIHVSALDNGSHFNLWTAPIPGLPNSMVVLDGDLVDFDLQQGKERWRIPGGYYVTNAVVANGTVYVAHAGNQQLEARDELTGAIKWTSMPLPAWGPTFDGNMIATQNLVFVGSTAGTYAVSQTTHKVVWSTPICGQLSITANGLLYISNGSITDDYQRHPLATVVAFNLH